MLKRKNLKIDLNGKLFIVQTICNTIEPMSDKEKQQSCCKCHNHKEKPLFPFQRPFNLGNR